MEFRQLEIFAAVVETGSFSRAGERMFVSQPTVTMQVKALEDELAQQLLCQLILQGFDLHGDGGLRDKHPLSGPGKAARLHNGGKDFKLTEFHV